MYFYRNINSLKVKKTGRAAIFTGYENFCPEK
jgi:hypothetical protein